MIKKLVKNIFSRMGLVLMAEYDHARATKYTELLEKIAQETNQERSNDCSIIIFSKDRAMQLDALLRSYFHYTKNVVPVHVLYYASEVEFKNGYENLISIYKNQGVQFRKEKSFRLDLIKLFEELSSSKVLFLVDDLFFKNSIDFKSFSSIDPKQYVASLRMGKHLTFSYTLQRKQKLPAFSISKEYTDMISWSFNDTELDWAYPLSVDGHLFDSKELKILVNELEYKAPNSFEEALQLMNPLFKKRKGLCFSESIIVNNPCNKVQTENNNISGQMTIEELNNKWLDGYRIKFEKEEGILNESAHQEFTLEFIKR